MSRLVTRLILVAAAAGLWQWHAALDAERAAARDTSHRIGRLVTSDEREAMTVAAVSVERGAERWLYGRVGGIWRNIDHHQAVASESAVAGLVDAILGGEGVVQSDDPERFGDYGIGTPDGWRVVLHGPDVLSAPDRDVQLAVQVGLPVPGLDGCFVKRVDRDAVWALDTDPRALLADAGPDEPPLLESTLLPSVWPGPRLGVRSILVERAWDGEVYGLDLRTRELTPEAQQRNEPPYTWVLQRPGGGEELEALSMLATAYNLYLRRATFDEVIDPSRAQELGLDLPAARLSIVPQTPPEGGALQPLQLIIGSPQGDGRVPVLNTFTGNLVLIEEDVMMLLVPPSEDLLPGAESNPWQRAMEAAQRELEARLSGFGAKPGR